MLYPPLKRFYPLRGIFINKGSVEDSKLCEWKFCFWTWINICLLYTSDAADEL